MNILSSATAATPPSPPRARPRDHTELPETDGSIVENYQEQPQSTLLTGAIRPVLDRLHPDGQYSIGMDNGIYYRDIDPPLDGCKSPDWFYVPGVPPTLDGVVRRSYVLWQEIIPPTIVIEYVSRDGAVERDRTPNSGKFWVYEQGICVPYYAVYEVNPGRVEVHRLVDGRYRPLAVNARGHYFIEPMGLELGIWQGTYHGYTLPWLRWYDAEGKLLPSVEEREELEKRKGEKQRRIANEQRKIAKEQRKIAEEQQEIAAKERRRAEKEQQIADRERQRADEAVAQVAAERERAERMAARMRALGIDPDQA